MSEQERLQHEIKESEQRWQRQGERLARWQEQRDHETRVEERDRLDYMIRQAQIERREIEELIAGHEAALKRAKKSDLIAEARRLERNQAYSDAVHTLENARDLDRNDLQIDREIQRLQALQERVQLLNDRIQRLTAPTRMKEIMPILPQVVRRVKKMLEEGGDDVAVCSDPLNLDHLLTAVQ